jgi:type IV secretory pathway TraG/TraD family ATPase VirD4
MQSGKVLLVNLSKGKIGEINMQLLGMILVSKIKQAAMARASLPPDERRDFFMYIDEFQNFVTPSIESILSEARKYRL